MQQKENEEYYITLIKNITFVGQLSTKGPIRAGPPRLHLFLGVLRAGPRRCPRGPSHVLLILSLQPAFLIPCSNSVAATPSPSRDGRRGSRR